MAKKQITVSDDLFENTTKPYDATNEGKARIKAETLNNEKADSSKSDDVSINITSQTYDSADAGENKTLTLELALSGDKANNYQLSNSRHQHNKAEITKKQITVTDNLFENTQKVYDGTNISNVSINQNILQIQRANNKSQKYIDIIITDQRYDSKEIGENSIILDLTLKGISSNNYSLNNDIYTIKGIIKPNKIILLDNIINNINLNSVFDNKDTKEIYINDEYIPKDLKDENIKIKAIIKYDKKDAGQRKANVEFKLEGENTNNFDITFPQIKDRSAKIEKKDINIMFKDMEFRNPNEFNNYKNNKNFILQNIKIENNNYNINKDSLKVI